MAKFCGMQTDGQVAEWFKAPVLKTPAQIHGKAREWLISAAKWLRTTRRSRTVLRFALAHKPAQSILSEVLRIRGGV